MNRLKELRESLGFKKQKDFASELQMPPNTYNNYEKGIREPNSDFWIAIAEKYQVSIDWLMGFSDDPHRVKFAAPSALEQKYRALDEHGKKLVDLVMQAETERIEDATRQQTVVIDFGTIRSYISSPAAGKNGLTENDYKDIPRTAEMPPDADYCITVSGDSMEPYISDGQQIFVKRDVPVGLYEVGVWCYQGGTYVKQFYEDAETVQLLSANPARQDKNLILSKEFADGLVFQGKVLGLRKLPKPVYNGNL